MFGFIGDMFGSIGLGIALKALENIFPVLKAIEIAIQACRGLIQGLLQGKSFKDALLQGLQSAMGALVGQYMIGGGSLGGFMNDLSAKLSDQLNNALIEVQNSALPDAMKSAMEKSIEGA